MARILVIRYSAFGDMVLSLGAFRTIRAHHSADELTVLTTPPFVGLVEKSGYFDRILIDERRKAWQLAGWLRLMRQLRARRFARVYDLQRNQRTGVLYQFLRSGRRLEWSGVVRGCSHHVPDDRAERRHICDKLAQQLRVAGIPQILDPDISWLDGEIGRYRLPSRYGLILAGSAPHRPEKRASPECFAGLAQHWLSGGITPVLLGTASEREPIDRIVRLCRQAIDLSGQTEFGDIAALARGAVGAVGNDTGAMHLIALAGCPSLVLFSSASDPVEVAPRGRRVQVLQRSPLATLEADEVIGAWEDLFV